MMTKMHKSYGTKLFAKQALHDFSTFGAIIPTSKYTARQMVQSISPAERGYVVELGAGSGVITAALEEHLNDSSRIIALEQSIELTDYLKERFSNLHIIQGDAADLQTLLGTKADSVTSVISALPFRLLNDATADKILATAHQLLPADGKLIQITYSWRKQHHPAFMKYFQLQQSSNVWLNIPPARIDVYKPKDLS